MPRETYNSDMEKEILFIFMEDYPDWECADALYFIASLGADQYRIRAVGLNENSIRSISGIRILPDYTIEEVPDDFSGLVVVGGVGWMMQMEEKIAAIRPVLESAVKRSCPIGAVGTGVDVLGTLGLLNKAVHTGNSVSELDMFSDMLSLSEPYNGQLLFRQEAGAIRNGPIVTARNISGLAFARAFLWTLDVDQRRADEIYSHHQAGSMMSILDTDADVTAEIL